MAINYTNIDINKQIANTLSVIVFVIILVSGQVTFASALVSNNTSASNTVHATGSTIVNTTSKIAPAKSTNNFFSTLSFEYATNLYNDTAYEKQSETDLMMDLGYRWNDQWSTSTSGVVTQDQPGQQKTSLSNIHLKVSKKLSNQGVMKSQLLAYLVAPTNEDARNIATYKGGVGLGYSFSYSSFVDTHLLFDLQKNIHEYNISADGNVNTEYKGTVATTISKKIAEVISISAHGAFIQGRSYLGTSKNKFETDLAVSYKFANNLSSSFGVANRADATKANGIDSNFSFFNENTTTIHAGIAWNL